jgi:hypothetical protein
MIDTGRPPQVRAEDVIARLRQRGFEVIEHGGHVIAVRDVARVVLPAAGRVLPDTFVRRVEHTLEPLLGAGWLIDEPAPGPPGLGDPADSVTGGVVVLDAVVDQCPTTGAWCSFLPSEPSVMGFGPTRHDALRDVKDAAAIWSGVPRDSIVLVTPTVV